MTPGALEELRHALSGRIWLSLHERAPNEAGQPMLAGPIQLPAGSFSVGRNGAVNVRDIAFTATRGGRAAYVGRWTPGRGFVSATALGRAQDVSEGQTVRLRRGVLRVGG